MLSHRSHYDACLDLPYFGRKLLGIRINQGFGRTGRYAGRNIAIPTAIAFDSETLLLLPADNAVWAYHETAPAADAATLLMNHRSLIISGKSPCDACLKTRCGIAVAAGYGQVLPVRPLHIQSIAGLRGLGHCLK